MVGKFHKTSFKTSITEQSWNILRRQTNGGEKKSAEGMLEM